ncbi:inter-alpha-trypsin inhibitor heavy chain H3-like isoform X4 [Xiphophorus couchianus]|uniref:inter-alpha-trypsin inhibitor heavy chain H3-like isoform X4 n=1 Tax=Xiphophorus couchianus TaxID=32473 RepID=UPI0010170759|nr:inter-alpha-trypsin inhibitor heavy chain H3-like isoform X4 [Xiphophorus couchianus]
MGRASVLLTVFGLLLALTASLPNKDDWDIYSFHINSTVTSRYATTVITSRVANRMNEPKEIEFHVQIPKNAFISRFRMMMDGQVYDGVVKTKEQAQEQYTRAVSRGESAGIVRSVGRTMEEFKTSVTVAAHKKVTFELTYEELLKRTHGKYELQIYARPMKPVEDFKVDVHIHEKAGIRFIDVKGGLSTLANAVTKTHADKQASVYFYPTVDQQKTCERCGEQGLNGDLVIVYDVNQDNGLGDIRISDGYFVHHFAPSNLPRIPKNVVFVIDRSGSMHGRKIEQTRAALIHILNDLTEDDFFGIICFDQDIFHWKRELVPATASNVERAKEFAQSIFERGATNINGAVLEGASMLNAQSREGSASILIFLTDGDPTAGEINLEKIQSNVREAIAEKFPLYCLGFGSDVNFEFLEKMSLQNNGVARRIYEDSDADLQLKGFYEEVATPLLTDVTMIYVGGSNLTQTNFSQYYNGSEIVVAGEITDNNIETFTPQVVAYSVNRTVTFSNTSGSTDHPSETVTENLLQRVWAYLTVKQLLERELLLSGPEKEKVNKEALELSLKYSFVTPLTSMVVTKPQGEKSVLHKPKEGVTPLSQGIAGSLPAGAIGSYPRFSPNPGIAGSLPAGRARSISAGSISGYPILVDHQTTSIVAVSRDQGRQLSGDVPAVVALPGSGFGGLGVSAISDHAGPPSPAGFGPPSPAGFGPPSPAGYGPPDPAGYGPPSPAGFGPPDPAGYGPPGSAGYGPPGSAGYGPPGSAGYGPPSPAGYGPPGLPGFGPPSPAGFGPPDPAGYGPPSPAGFGPPDPAGFGPPSHAGYTPSGPAAFGHPGSRAHISHRFLVKTENHSASLCFDVPGSHVLKLLHHPSKGMYMNGELNPVTNGGFKKIFIQVQGDHYVDIDPEGIRVLQGTSVTRLTGQNPIQAGSLTVTARGQETDVTAEDLHIVILVHQRDGNKFLWPVLKKRPTASNIDGILVFIASTPANFTVAPQPYLTLLKIPGIPDSVVFSSFATDYSVTSPVTVQCWLTMNPFVLGKPLYFYVV